MNISDNWLGRLPEDWKVARFNSLYQIRNEKVSDKDYPALSVTKKGIVPQLENAAKTNDGDNRKLVKIGDFAINSRSDRRGSCGISKYNGSVSLINTVLSPIDNVMNPQYYDWLFHTVQFGDEFYKWGHGIVDDLWTTNWQDMKNIVLPLPSSQEQEKIAKYLNQKCSKIDNLLNNLQQEIRKIEEYRKSRITEVITKGLDNNIELKDTNINWIGKIPREWKIEKIKFLTKSINKGISPNYIETVATPIITQAVFSQGIFNYHQVRQSTDSYKLNSKGQVRRNDILLATTGGGVLGKTFYFDSEANDNFLASADVCIIRPNESEYLSKLLYYVIKINYENLNGFMSTGSTNQIHLDMMAFNNMYVPVMPKEKQKEIVDYLDKIDDEIDEIITQKNNLLKKLNQYKQSLIYEYVTGKKQVPDVGEY